MKKIGFILFLVFLNIVHSYAQKSIDLNWQSDFETAKKMAKSQNKHILIYFTGSDWSNSCKILNKDFFYTEKFQNIAEEQLILLRVNSPRRVGLISKLQQDKNLNLSRKYKQRIFPTVILTDADGNEIAKVESYNYLHDTTKHYALLDRAIKN